MRKLAASFLCALLVAPAALPASAHVVSPADLQKDLRQSTQARQKNAAQLRSFLGSGLARNAMSSAGLDAAKVEKAIPMLSDAELARLADQSRQVQNDFAAGRLTNSQVTYIILGAILIIVVAILAS